MATKPVSQWRLDDAVQAAKSDLPSDYRICVQMLEDEDQWRGGEEWPGQRSGDPRTDAVLTEHRLRQFVPDDVLSEGVDNRTNGLIGQEADVQLLPLSPSGENGDLTDAEEAFAKTTLASLSQFWNRKHFWDFVRLALNRLHYAKRTVVLPFVAPGNMVTRTDSLGRTTSELPTRNSLDDALDVIDIEAPKPDTAIRYIDPRTKRPVGVIISELDGRQQAQVWWVNPATKATEVRLYGVNDAPRNPSTGETAPSMVLDTKGRLPVAEARGSRIVTKSARRLQSQLNLATTYTSRTVEMSGSRERFFMNTQPPGIWLKFPPSQGRPLAVDETTPGGPYYKHSVPWVIGADVSNNLVGTPQTETRPDGTIVQTNAQPSVEALDPVDPAFTTGAAEAISLKLYRRMKQGHLGLSKTGEASGTAYVQARAQFEADLKSIKVAAEGMIRDALEYVLALAGLIHPGSAGILDNWRIEVTLKVTAGPVTTEDVANATTLRNAHGISTREMMVRTGVDDAQAMQDEIEADPLYWAEFWSKIGPAIQALTSQVPGLTAAGAGALMKLPVAMLEVLATGLPPLDGLSPEARALLGAAEPVPVPNPNAPPGPRAVA